MQDEPIKFYHFFFEGVKKPIIMEAESRAMADAMLEEFGSRIGNPIPYDRLQDIRIEMPVTRLRFQSNHKACSLASFSVAPYILIAAMCSPISSLIQ